MNDVLWGPAFESEVFCEIILFVESIFEFGEVDVGNDEDKDGNECNAW